jgi:SAM-dependent methyltransferase
MFDISGEAAETLSDFFRRGAGAPSLRVPGLETRFLGDLYQDLSQHARSTYALLQTPDFVEAFILDRTFEPSVDEFGLPNTSVIDPTCGSGHFLLGAFDRLIRRWTDREPNTDIRVLVERALNQVTGVDINPFAVAIARFRLMVAALKVCGLSSLERAPSFPIRVATGDSLLEWGDRSSHQGDVVAALQGQRAFAYETEDADLLADYLDRRYTVVVGNPPYITVKDNSTFSVYAAASAHARWT